MKQTNALWESECLEIDPAPFAAKLIHGETVNLGKRIVGRKKISETSHGAQSFSLSITLCVCLWKKTNQCSETQRAMEAPHHNKTAQL